MIENFGRMVKAVHGTKKIVSDPEFEIGMTKYLSKQYKYDELLELNERFIARDSDFDMRMRRTVWRAVSRRFGNSVYISTYVRFKHIETFEIGDGVFIGTQTYIQGMFDGRCTIGNHVWIGPQSYFDARDLIIEDYVGWGPGAKVLCSTHIGMPINVPIIQTDLNIKPVRIGEWADIGTNAIILPGVTIGKGSIVGAGAVVTEDVPQYAVVAGVPARFLHWREGYEHM